MNELKNNKNYESYLDNLKNPYGINDYLLNELKNGGRK